MIDATTTPSYITWNTETKQGYESAWVDCSVYSVPRRYPDFVWVVPSCFGGYTVQANKTRNADMIQKGQAIPTATLSELGEEGMVTHNTEELFANKRVVLFAVPGAYTPTCSEAHLPGYVVLADDIKAKGIDIIACVSVNDAFVMQAWGEAQNATEIMMLADGDASFTKALGLEMDTATFGGIRSQRYAMVIENGVVTQLNVEEAKQFEASKAETILAAL